MSMNTIELKIQDVFHDQWMSDGPDVSEVEEYIERGLNDDRITGIRVARGYMNSPIFIDVEMNSARFSTLQEMAREVVELFSYVVSGVDVVSTIDVTNLMIV